MEEPSSATIHGRTIFAALRGRTFFCRHDFSTHGRTFFRMFTWKNVLSWMRNPACGRRFFHVDLRKNFLPWLRIPACGRFFRVELQKNLLPHMIDALSPSSGRWFFHWFLWMKVLPREPTDEPSSAWRRRSIFHMPKKVIPHVHAEEPSPSPSRNKQNTEVVYPPPWVQS